MKANEKAPAVASEHGASEINQLDNSISEKLLKEFISIRNQFLPLYSKTGLLSVEGRNGIQLREEEFLATFPDYESKPFACESSTCTGELFTTFEGVRFFCIR
jgi:hypothetical protein